MKFNINTSDFTTGLKFISSLTQANYTNNVFSYILIQAKDDQINIIGSNENVSVNFIIKDGFTIIEEGETLVKGKVILNIISKLKENEVKIELIDNILRIMTENYTSNINTADINIFPIINFDVDGWEHLEMRNEIFNLGIKKVQNCSLTHSEKINKFNGIYIDSISEKEYLRFVATDSYKLAIKKFPIKDLPEISLLIKNNTLLQITNYIKLNEKIKIYKKNNKLVFRTNDFILSCPMIESNFPNIDNLIKVQSNTSFKVSIKELTNGLERIIALTNNDKNYAATISINDDYIELICKNLDLGNSIEKIKITNLQGNKFKISFNAAYMLDLLKNFNNDIINFSFSDENGSIYMFDEKEENFLQLIVPLTNL